MGFYAEATNHQTATMDLLHPQRAEIIEWLRTLDVYALTGKTHRELFDTSYPTWSRNARAWDRRLATGGTYTLRAIMWYQHVWRTGSTDSRPGVILDAITEAMRQDVAALA